MCSLTVSVQTSSPVKGPIWHPGHGPALHGSNFYYNDDHSLAWASGSPKVPEAQLQIIRLHVADIWAWGSQCRGCVPVTQTAGTQLDSARVTG